MDIGNALASAPLFDVLTILFLFGMFVLGYIQGTIRRVLGLASILFSFLLAGQIRDPLGAFLASNWTQYPREYSYMLAYLAVFLFAAILFSIIIQSFYHHQPLFESNRFIDEVLGGTLGLLQGLLLIGIGIVILDSYFAIPGVARGNTELPFLRSLFDAYDRSGTASLFRGSLIPGTFAVIGALIPADVRRLFPIAGA
ncbi:MAG TPA: CvpA family protein [Candidatus Dormibacteraeota bacterium]|nr:CvpA family protein [Candidatus Dormibacteraeota bacterium]